MTEISPVSYTVSALYRKPRFSPMLHADLTVWNDDGVPIQVHVRGVRSGTIHRSLPYIAEIVRAEPAVDRIMWGETRTGDHRLSQRVMNSRKALKHRWIRFTIDHSDHAW